MAKSAKVKAATTANSNGNASVVTAKGKAEASEIDDIFAGGSSSKPKSDDAEDSTSAVKKSKKKKRKREDGADGVATPKDTSESAAKPASAKAPVTVVDTSTEKEKAVKQVAQPAAAKKRKQTDKSAKEKAEEEDELFKDSRGTSSRRKTDDGLSIYSANELGISEAGGDTPLCPFDCECCF